MPLEVLGGQPVNSFNLGMPSSPSPSGGDVESLLDNLRDPFTYSEENTDSESGVIDEVSDGSEKFADHGSELLDLLEFNDSPDSAIKQLQILAAQDPAYKELYLELLAERENTKQAQAWYENFNNTYYQRTTKDLEAAGLNPWLALQSLGSSGSGSVSPAGTWSGTSGSTLSAKQKEMQTDIDRQWISGVSGLIAAIAGAMILALL